MKKSMHWAGVMAVIMALVMIGSAVALAAGAGGTGALTADEINGIINTTTDASQVSSPFTAVANSVRSSAVSVRNYQIASSRYNNSYGFYFGYGYGNGSQGEATERLTSFGSGVVVSNYGHILTNYHVVEDASRLTVTIDGSDEEYEATLVGSDEDLDIAVLHVDNLPLSAVALGDSDQLQVGEWAIVIGTPLSENFARTVTVGVVSALDRQVTDTTYDRYGRRTNITNTMIQVDAAINSGNSGGGMFNTLGQLMGIPARKYSGTSLSATSIDNIGMCIPINVAKPLLQEVLENYGGTTKAEAQTNNNTASQGAEKQTKPVLGVSIATLQNTMSGMLPQGVIVTKVDDNSNALRGQMKVGDIIVEMNGEIVTTTAQLIEAVNACSEGDEVTLKVYRTPAIEVNESKVTINDTTLLNQGEYVDLNITMLINASL